MVVESETMSNLCPECGASTISCQERGDTVCECCGLVVNEREPDNSHNDIRAYTKQEKDRKERTGCPVSIMMPDISLSTIIDRTKIKNPDLKRATKWNTHMSWEKKNMLMAITELKRMGTNLNFPDRVKNEVIRMYKDVFKKNLLRGRSINGMIAACAYYTCKKEKIPITLQEILEGAAISTTIVKKCYKILVQELNLKTPHMDPVSLIPRFCAELGLDMTVENQATQVLRTYSKEASVCGKDPKGLCAGAIYLIAKLKNKKISQKDVANAVGVTEVTLRSRYKDLLKSIKFKFFE